MTVETLVSREEYRKLCDDAPEIPLFSQAWWLDATAGKNWSAVIASKKSGIVGALPFVLKRKWGFTQLAQPKLTQTLGPWLRKTDKSYPKQLAHEKEVLKALAEGLPQAVCYRQNWHSSVTNWLPFYWLGYTQTTRFSYRLDLAGGEAAIWSGLQENIRREIRKAKNRFELQVAPGSLSEVTRLSEETFRRQSKRPSYPARLVEEIDRAAAARQACDRLVAFDPEGKSHAGAYIVRDLDTAYYLIGGGDPELRQSGAMSLVLWEAILRQPAHVRYFDFEGSMIEPIERYFRAFGALQVPYYRISKVNSRILALALCLRGMD